MQERYYNFTKKNGGKQLTRWMKKEELVPFTVTFHKYYGADCYGREYIIKSNRKKVNTKWAIFIKKENLLRREQDIMFKKSIGIVDLILMDIPRKIEGISILKTISKRF